jgi:hypothetical protein
VNSLEKKRLESFVKLMSKNSIPGLRPTGLQAESTSLSVCWLDKAIYGTLFYYMKIRGGGGVTWPTIWRGLKYDRYFKGNATFTRGMRKIFLKGD